MGNTAVCCASKAESTSILDDPSMRLTKKKSGPNDA